MKVTKVKYKLESPYAPFLPGFMCCRVCAKVWEVESAIAPALAEGTFTPTDRRGDIPTCRYGPCQEKLDSEINRLIKLGWQRLYPRPGFLIQ